LGGGIRCYVTSNAVIKLGYFLEGLNMRESSNIDYLILEEGKLALSDPNHAVTGRMKFEGYTLGLEIRF